MTDLDVLWRHLMSGSLTAAMDEINRGIECSAARSDGVDQPTPPDAETAGGADQPALPAHSIMGMDQ